MFFHGNILMTSTETTFSWSGMFANGGFANNSHVLATCIIGYEPADLTVHPPRTAEGGFIFFV